MEGGGTKTVDNWLRESPAFKAKVALAAFQYDEPITQLAGRFEAHSSQIHWWKRVLVEDHREAKIARIGRDGVTYSDGRI